MFQLREENMSIYKMNVDHMCKTRRLSFSIPSVGKPLIFQNQICILWFFFYPKRSLFIRGSGWGLLWYKGSKRAGSPSEVWFSVSYVWESFFLVDPVFKPLHPAPSHTYTGDIILIPTHHSFIPGFIRLGHVSNTFIFIQFLRVEDKYCKVTIKLPKDHHQNRTYYLFNNF